jgi:hypothetical protein
MKTKTIGALGRTYSDILWEVLKNFEKHTDITVHFNPSNRDVYEAVEYLWTKRYFRDGELEFNFTPLKNSSISAQHVIVRSDQEGILIDGSLAYGYDSEKHECAEVEQTTSSPQASSTFAEIAWSAACMFVLGTGVYQIGQMIVWCFS